MHDSDAEGSKNAAEAASGEKEKSASKVRRLLKKDTNGNIVV
jgi:hypothetical protein